MKKLLLEQRRPSILLGYSLLGLAFLMGCAADRNLDDYKREKLREDLGHIQAAAGVYRGTLQSNLDHRPLGAVELTLQASTRSDSATKDTTKAGSSVVLSGSLRLFGNRLMSIKIKDASYDPDTGLYQANIPVKQQNGESTEITLTGTLSENRFEGNIEAYNFRENGGSISLERDAPLPQNISGNIGKDGSPSSLPTDDDNTALGSFQGTTTFIRSGASRPVSLVILAPNRSSEEELLNFFLPIRPVQVTLNYGDSFQVLHPNVQWNRQDGRLLGDAPLLVNSKTVNVSLKCDKTQNQGQPGLDCKTYTTAQGLIARTQVFSSGSQTPLPGQSNTMDPITLQYTGQARLLDGSLIQVSMTASYRSRSREEEIIDLYFPSADKVLTVTVKFFENGVPATFPAARWDLRTHSLNGETTSSIGAGGGASTPGNQYNLTLSCTNYQFNGSSQDDFDCLYFSNQLSAPISIRLKRSAAPL